MSRAGREPAEDLVRRICSAFDAIGLRVSSKMNILDKPRNRRLISVGASREGWPHKHPLIVVEGVTDLAGNTLRLFICCAATELDPVEAVFAAPHVTDAEVTIDELPMALHVILRERDAVMQMIVQGVKPPFDGLHWSWKVPGDAFRIPGVGPSSNQED